jgi:hypothetical protein
VGIRAGWGDERGGFYRGEVGFVSDQDRWNVDSEWTVRWRSVGINIR